MALNFEKLIVWQKAFSLTEDVYILLVQFPKEEKYALADQIRRSAVSIPSNIAEWSGRSSINEKNYFFHIAKWSAMELHTQLLLAERFWYIDKDSQEKISITIEEVVKMLVVMTRPKKT